MKNSLKTLRPVGNPITLRKEQLDYTQFGGFHIDFYQSGTAALAAAIDSIKRLRPDRTDRPEVILPAYACPDLISAVLYAGATPVLVDLEPETCWMSLEQIEKRITRKTIAIIAVRFLGIAERMQQLLTLSHQYQLTLIEDSAQGFPHTAPDSYWQGDVIVLSFGRGKPINLLGGGAVLTKNETIKNHLLVPAPQTEPTSERLKYFGKVQTYNLLINPVLYGLVLKLPGLSIGETVFKPLKHVSAMPGYIKDRMNANINTYNKLPNISLKIRHKLELLGSPDILDLPTRSHHEFTNPLLRYPLLIKDKKMRDDLHEALLPLGSSIMYRRPLDKINGVSTVLSAQDKEFIHAENFADRLITLPAHKDVSGNVLGEIFFRIGKTLN